MTIRNVHSKRVYGNLELSFFCPGCGDEFDLCEHHPIVTPYSWDTDEISEIEPVAVCKGCFLKIIGLAGDE